MSLTSLQVGEEPPSVSLSAPDGSPILQPSITVAAKNQTDPRLLEYPPEILLMIHSFLPVPSQACLALTCKTLYNLFGNSLQHPDLAWPKGIFEQGSAAYGLPKIALRTQFLLQLKTPDNPFCVACLKLHHRNEFPENVWDIPKIERKCGFGINVVDLCHCLALTPMTGAKIREWLRSGIAPTNLDQRILDVLQLDDRNPHRALRHRCMATNRRHGTLRLEIRAELVGDEDNDDNDDNERNERLMVCTRHSLAITQDGIRQGWEQLGAVFSPQESVFGCPHYNLIHIGWYNPDTAAHICQYCPTAFFFLGNIPTEYESKSESESAFVWRSFRNLGSNAYSRPWQTNGRCCSEERRQMKRCLESLNMY
ncbi:hypothetical protein ASPCAL03136 [Aspergillus calidoustus]|uniref:F-box domain-containing protein n=1 Tax=Aspergillus calidoustus TaxID=454130 RepID=A0A0U4ZXH7_ASPCI|nr:hypothetical protein ASPCAL03136 [Aspergillus calidoustus]